MSQYWEIRYFKSRIIIFVAIALKKCKILRISKVDMKYDF